MHADTVRPDGLSTEQLLTPQDGLALGLDRELIWSWNQIVLQSRYPDTPPGFSGPEEQQQAIALWEEQYAAYRRTHEHALCPRPILPPEQFVGREEELAAIHAAIEELRTQTADVPALDIQVLNHRKEGLTARKSALAAALQDLHARLTSNTAAERNIASKVQEMSELESRYSWMKSLADTANGALNGKDKISLETYVQTTYFDHILERANLRLQKMSGGQYDLERRKAANDQRSQSGLELDIIDHINTTRRSVNTLSGGEAFLASLALALGLSDEVQMSTGIRLDTLFVDEGFGSLDSEALNKAYLTLAGLTEGSRLVGIISHVEALKEKIDRQIVVKKDRTGGSSAVIVTQ